MTNARNLLSGFDSAEITGVDWRWTCRFSCEEVVSCGFCVNVAYVSAVTKRRWLV
jgi:hypothetical protein